MRHHGAAALTCIMSICWTSWAGQGSDKQHLVMNLLCCPLRLKEKPVWELRRAGSVTAVPPLSVLLGLCPVSPCGPTYQLVETAGCVFRLSLCCVIEWDRLVRWACSGVLKGLRLTAWPDQAVTVKYHRLPLSLRHRDYKDSDSCLSARPVYLTCLPWQNLHPS